MDFLIHELELERMAANISNYAGPAATSKKTPRRHQRSRQQTNNS